MGELKYIASVITPFHNTDLCFFKKAFESIKNQTVGVENVEWIIVVHNSEKKYLEGVREMTADYENIKVFELNNNVRSASSPRNYAMDRATGKYIFFLDSDDYFTVDCIKEVTDRMEKTCAKMAKMRSERELEDENVVELVDHRVHYDQTQDMIIFKKNDPNLRHILTFAHMTPWSQIFLREFIEEHHLRYNEDIAIGEDMEFTMRAMKCADSILVLPQTIGYVYYVNHASTLQQMQGMSPESVMGMLMNIQGFVVPGLNEGMDVRNLFWISINDTTKLMLACPRFTEENKEKARAIVAPIINKIEPLEGDGKFYTKEQAEDLMNFVKSAYGIGEQDGTVSSMENNTLLSILHENKNSYYSQLRCS